MRKKGFTLIELLAVIIVLAIIALIATPIIFNVIENAKLKSLENSSYGVIDAVRTQYAENLLNSTNGQVKLNGNVTELTVAGEQPIEGTWTIDNTKNSDEKGIKIVGLKFASMKDYTCTNYINGKIESKVTCTKDSNNDTASKETYTGSVKITEYITPSYLYESSLFKPTNSANVSFKIKSNTTTKLKFDLFLVDNQKLIISKDDSIIKEFSTSTNEIIELDINSSGTYNLQLFANNECYSLPTIGNIIVDTDGEVSNININGNQNVIKNSAVALPVNEASYVKDYDDSIIFTSSGYHEPYSSNYLSVKTPVTITGLQLKANESFFKGYSIGNSVKNGVKNMANLLKCDLSDKNTKKALNYYDDSKEYIVFQSNIIFDKIKFAEALQNNENLVLKVESTNFYRGLENYSLILYDQKNNSISIEYPKTVYTDDKAISINIGKDSIIARNILNGDGSISFLTTASYPS